MSNTNLTLNFKSRLAEALAPLKKVKETANEVHKTAKKPTTEIKKWFNETKKANGALLNLNKDINRTADGMAKVGKGFNLLKAGVAGVVSYRMASAILKATEAAMDMREQLNLFNVALGETADQTDIVLKKLSDVAGLDLTGLRSAAGTYSMIARSMGMGTEAAAQLSIGSIRLAEDLASLLNVPVEQAMGDLRSGLVGQSEAVYKYGIDVTELALREEARAQGITKSVRAMTQGEKFALRYALIMKQTSLAHGDFAKTIESPANQLRVLRQRLITLQRTFGTLFLQIMGNLLPALNALAIVLIKVLSSLAALVGYTEFSQDKIALPDLVEDTEDSIDNINGIGTALKKLKASMLGFDELNIMTDPTAASGAGSVGDMGNIIDQVVFPTPDFDKYEIKQKADEIAKDIVDFFTNAFGGISLDPLAESFQNLGVKIEPIINFLKETLNGFFYNVLVPLAEWTIEEALPAFINMLGGAADFLSASIEALKPFGVWFWESFLEPIEIWTGGVIVSVFTELGEKMTEISEWMKENKKEVDVLTSIFIGLAVGVGSVVLAIKAIIGIIAALKIVVAGATTVVAIFNAVFVANPIGLIIILIVALIATIILFVKNWDEIWSFAKFMIEFAARFIIVLLKNIADFFINTWENIKNKITMVLMVIVGLIRNKFDEIRNNIFIVVSVISGIFSGMWNGFINGASNAWNGIKSIFSNLANFFGDIFSNAWNKVKSIFSSGGAIFSGITDGIVSAFKSVVNAIISGINRVIALPFNSINGILNTIRSINIFGLTPFSGVIKYNALSVPQIPQLALGGIAKSSSLVNIAEAGYPEAVLPLKPSLLQKYLEPVMGNMNVESETIYSAVYDAMTDSMESAGDKEAVFNIYVDGVLSNSMRELRRKNVRSGKIIIPVGG